jgi:hypothetical protein
MEINAISICYLEIHHKHYEIKVFKYSKVVLYHNHWRIPHSEFLSNILRQSKTKKNPMLHHMENFR